MSPVYTDKREFFSYVIGISISFVFSKKAYSYSETQPVSIETLLHSRDPNETSLIIGSPGQKVIVQSSVDIPAGLRLIIHGDLIGDKRSELVLYDGTTLEFHESQSLDVSLRFHSGSIKVYGLNYSGRAHLASISISGPGPYKDISIKNFRISDANFGILRQGASSSLSGAEIENGTFERLRGDAIEWNVGIHDTGVKVGDIVIDTIDNSSGQVFWGIGIGFAGGRYNTDGIGGQKMRGFTIRNIRGSRVRQLIHVEKCENFSIENIYGNNISDIYSKKSGLDVALVACYACTDFTVNKVLGDSAVVFRAGVRRGEYVEANKNISASDINITVGNLVVELGGGPKTYANLKNIRLGSGYMTVKGTVANLELSSIYISTAHKDDHPFVQYPNYFDGSQGVERSHPYKRQISGLKFGKPKQ